MKFRRLGKTGLKVSEVGMGCWAIGGNEHGNSYGPTNDADSIKAIEKALDLGCNFFDTADVYGWGHSEELLGKALKHQRDTAIIATKVGGDFTKGIVRKNFDPKYIRYALDKSLERLQTNYIDIYQLHNPDLQTIRDGTAFKVLEDLKIEGKIRFYGISIHDPIEGMEAMKFSGVSTIQVVYNMLEQNAAKGLFKFTRANGVGIIAREPLANGFLTGKYNMNTSFPKGDIRSSFPAEYKQFLISNVEKIKKILAHRREPLPQLALKFVLWEDAVSTAIPGIKNDKQALENLTVSRVADLEREDLVQLKFW